MQEYDFVFIHKKGEEILKADCLPRRVHATALHAFAVTLVWPSHAEKQVDLHEIPRVFCGHTQGDNNIVICDACNRCFRLRCLLPPRYVVHSGSWFCPASDPIQGERAASKLSELLNVNTCIITLTLI